MTWYLKLIFLKRSIPVADIFRSSKIWNRSCSNNFRMEFSVFVHCGVLSMFTYLIISNKTYLAVIATAQLLEFWASQITNSKKHKLDWNPVLSSNFNITNLLSWDLVYQGVIYVTFIFSRRPVLSTDQGIPSCFYFRISWILIEQRCFYFFCPLGFLEGLRSLKHWLLQKVSMKNLDQKFKFFIIK